MSFWQIDVNPFISIIGSVFVSWAVVAVSRKQATRAEMRSAESREEYFHRNLKEQREIIQDLARGVLSTTQRLAHDLRTSDRENAALTEITRLTRSLSRMVRIGAAADREGPDSQAMTYEFLAGAASAARISVLLAPGDDEFTNLLKEAVGLFGDRVSEFTSFGTRPKPNYQDMAKFAGGIIGSTIAWFRPEKDRAAGVSQMRLIRDELDVYLRRDWPPNIEPFPSL